MEFTIEKYPQGNYLIREPHRIPTPRLVVFEAMVDRNITTMKKLLASVRPDLGLPCLCPHVKTHKSVWATEKLLQQGVRWFKCTPNELDMLLAAKADNIFIAFPLVSAAVKFVAERMISHPDVHFYVQVSKPQHVRILADVARQYHVTWHYFIDLDVGMGRTGIPPQQALSFYHSIENEKSLVFAGLHAYDGHNQLPTLEERRAEAYRALSPVMDLVQNFARQGISVPHLIVGGTPSFLPDAEYLYGQNLPCEILLSPGTWIYFDSGYGQKMPDTFLPAALILCQVMDKVGDDRYTLNLGHKRWAVDQGPIELFSVAGTSAVKWSEEHTVVKAPSEEPLEIGDYILIVPRHVCSTVNLWEYFCLIGNDGKIKMERCPIDGRNR